jgi:hypothetical protein
MGPMCGHVHAADRIVLATDFSLGKSGPSRTEQPPSRCGDIALRRHRAVGSSRFFSLSLLTRLRFKHPAEHAPRTVHARVQAGGQAVDEDQRAHVQGRLVRMHRPKAVVLRVCAIPCQKMRTIGCTSPRSPDTVERASKIKSKKSFNGHK